MQNIEDDYSLAPGKRGVYKVVVKIPSDWGEDGEDEKWVSFVAREPEMAEGGGLVAMSEDDPVFQDFSVAPGTYKPYEHQMTPETDRNQTHMQVIEITDAETDGTVVSDAPVTYATGGERPDRAKPADGSSEDPDKPSGGSSEDSGRPSGRPSGDSDDSDDSPGMHLYPNGTYDPMRIRRQGEEYLWPIGSGTRFNYPTYGAPGQSGGATSADGSKVPGNAATAIPARPGATIPSGTDTSVTLGEPGAASATGAVPTGSASSATPVTGSASSTPATSSVRSGSSTPTTADATDVGLVTAAALAGVAVASAGMVLKDKEKSE